LSNLLDWNYGDVALVLSERIINMPAAIAAPSYKMLLEEIQWANDDVLAMMTLAILNHVERTLRIHLFLDIFKNLCTEQISERDRRRTSGHHESTAEKTEAAGISLYCCVGDFRTHLKVRFSIFMKKTKSFREMRCRSRSSSKANCLRRKGI
jgi:hypothetical protein